MAKSQFCLLYCANSVRGGQYFYVRIIHTHRRISRPQESLPEDLPSSSSVIISLLMSGILPPQETGIDDRRSAHLRHFHGLLKNFRMKKRRPLGSVRDSEWSDDRGWRIGNENAQAKKQMLLFAYCIVW